MREPWRARGEAPGRREHRSRAGRRSRTPTSSRRGTARGRSTCILRWRTSYRSSLENGSPVCYFAREPGGSFTSRISCGAHAFPRFRNTYLRNYTSTPPGVYRFWMGHASGKPERTGETMSDRYDKAEHERAVRKEGAERAGLGFKLPRGVKPVQTRKLVQLRQQNCRFGPNGPKTEILAPPEMAASL